MRPKRNGHTANPVRCAAELLGGFEATGRICDVSGKAVQKWVRAGRLPRTEATGETNYAERMAKADARVDKDALLATVFQRRAVKDSAPRAAS